MEVDAERLAAIDKVAAGCAIRRVGYDAIEDYIATARLLWLEYIQRRPEKADCDLPLLNVIISRRLLDWDRLERGRGAHRRKPHYKATSFEDFTLAEGTPIEWADLTVDVEAQAFERAEPASQRLEALIDLVAMAAEDEEDRGRTETICRMLADGRTLAEIGEALGFTESRACQLVHGLAEKVRAHAYASTVLCAA